MTRTVRFQNLDPPPERRGSFVDMLRFVLAEYRRALAENRRNPPTPVIANDGEALRDNTSRTSITWIGHSSFLIQIGGRSILTDSVWSKTSGAGPFGFSRLVSPGMRLADLPPIDLVLISHNHYDHLDYSTICWLGNKPTYLVPARLGGWFHALGCEKVHGVAGGTRLNCWACSSTLCPPNIGASAPSQTPTPRSGVAGS